mgnify:FL=1
MSLLPAIIRSVSFQKYILQLKRVINPPIPLLLKLRNCATVAKGKLKPMYFIRAKIMRLTFPMSKSRLQLPEKIFIWYWFMASQNIQWCLPQIKKSSPKRMWSKWQEPIFRDGRSRNTSVVKSRSCKGKSILLLLSTGERHPWHTLICKRRRQTLVPDETSGLPSTLP